MRLYFDACIWIDYLWGTQKNAKLKKETQNLLSFIEKNNHSVLSSVVLNMEISGHFKDWYILQKIIKEGYSYRDLPNLKKKKKWNSLSGIEMQKINKYFEDILELSWVESFEMSGLGKKGLEMFSVLTLEYHLDFVDAFHFVIAIDNCRFLITRDEDMREKARKFLKDYSLEKDFEVLRPKELLGRF